MGRLDQAEQSYREAAETLAALRDSLAARPGDMNFLVADTLPEAADSAGRLRLLLAKDNNLIPPDKWEFTRVLDFPMFEWDANEKRWAACHHPFTAPKWEDYDRIDNDPGSVKAQA